MKSIFAIGLLLVLFFGCCGLTPSNQASPNSGASNNEYLYNYIANNPPSADSVPNTTSAKGFGTAEVKKWSLDSSGTFTIQLANNGGGPIRLNSINVTIGSSTASIPITEYEDLIGQGSSSSSFTSQAGVFGALPVGTDYNAKIQIGYTDLYSNFPYVNSGTLTGKVS